MITRQIIIPALILLLTGAILVTSKNGLSENTSRWHTCTNWGEDLRPPSDILFIGTSRTFRAINITQLKNGIKSAGHDVGNIEMIWTDFPNILAKTWALDDYLSTRVKPKIVIVENSMSQKPRDYRERKNNANLVMLPASQRYMPPSVHYRMQKYLNSKFDNSWARVFDPGYMTSLEFRIHQWRLTLYDFFDSPKHAMMSRDKHCPSEKKTWNTNLVEDRDDFGNMTIQDEDHQQLIENVSSYIEYAPLSDRRKYEVTMMSYLLERVESINPQKIYLWFPGNYSLTYEKASQESFEKLFPQVDRIIGSEIVETLKFHNRQQIFYNENHLNHAGRKHATQLWIDLLNKDISALSDTSIAQPDG